jgi:hypothetical protein
MGHIAAVRSPALLRDYHQACELPTPYRDQRLAIDHAL